METEGTDGRERMSEGMVYVQVGLVGEVVSNIYEREKETDWINNQ